MRLNHLLELNLLAMPNAVTPFGAAISTMDLLLPWLSVVFISLALSVCVVLLIGYSRGWRFDSPAWRFVWTAISVLAAMWMTDQILDRLLPGNLAVHRWTQLLALAGSATIASWWTFRQADNRLSTRYRRIMNFTACACAIGSILWLGVHYRDISASAMSNRELQNSLADYLVVSFHSHAKTDAGRELTLYQWEPLPTQAKEMLLKSVEPSQTAKDDVIVRGDSSIETNCHGWVFTGGQYFLLDDAVEYLLEDNGYQRVPVPSPGDVVVYRDNSMQILHTGLVQGLLQDGTVMVESKWGIGGQYLHSVQDQPYSQNFEYYRTTRPSHQIIIKPRSDSGPQTNPTPLAMRRHPLAVKSTGH